MSALRVSVVVPTLDRRESVVRLLRALDAQTLPAAHFEAVVAIDGARDGTSEAVDALATRFHLRRVWQERRGAGSARNAGARLAEGEILLFLDDDMEPAPALLAGHLARHDADRALGVVGAVPIALPRDATWVMQYRAEGFARKMEQLEGRRDQLAHGDVYAGNFSVRRDAFHSAGGYDEEFQVYGHEDYELARRLGAAGVRFVFEAGALAHQHYTKSLRALAANVEAEGRTAVLLARKHPEALASLELGTYGRRSPRAQRRIAAHAALGRAYGGLVSRLVADAERAERGTTPATRAALFTRYDRLFEALYWIGAERALRECGAPPHRIAIRDVARWIAVTRTPQPSTSS